MVSEELDVRLAKLFFTSSVPGGRLAQALQVFNPVSQWTLGPLHWQPVLKHMPGTYAQATCARKLVSRTKEEKS